MENKDFENMLDDYIEFQVDLKLTEQRLIDVEKDIEGIKAKIEKYSMVALYVHIVGDLQVELLDTEVRKQELLTHYAELEARKKGFEGRKKDVIEDTFGPQLG